MEREPSELLATRRWVEDFVVGLNFCPFAGPVLHSAELEIQLCEASTPEGLLEFLHQRFSIFASQPTPLTELVVHPRVLLDFSEYNQFLELVDFLIEDLDLLGTLQVASFHPQYCFAGCAADAPENFTNRSPYPMLHLLREDSVSEALKNYSNPQRISQNNVEKLRTRSSAELEAELDFIRLTAMSER